jgi:GTPase SAR1 family protein
MEVMCDSNIGIDYEATGKSNDLAVKIILLGDSAVGKSKYGSLISLYLHLEVKFFLFCCCLLL